MMQNPKNEQFKITGWEIVPHVAQEKKADLADQSQSANADLATVLKRVISESTSKIKVASRPREQMKENNVSAEGALRAVPITVVATENENADVVTPRFAANRKKVLRNSTMVGELFDCTFVLPHNMAIDKIDLPRKEGKTSHVPQLSFRERLQGWNIERRQRSSGTCDTFYRHPHSTRTFRSITEVINFLLYEIYPDNHKKENKKTIGENLDNNRRAQGSSRKRKQEST